MLNILLNSFAKHMSLTQTLGSSFQSKCLLAQLSRKQGISRIFLQFSDSYNKKKFRPNLFPKISGKNNEYIESVQNFYVDFISA